MPDRRRTTRSGASTCCCRDRRAGHARLYRASATIGSARYARIAVRATGRSSTAPPRTSIAPCPRARSILAAAARPCAVAAVARRRRAPPAAGAALPDPAGVQPVQPARRRAAGRGELGDARSARSAPTRTAKADFGSGTYDGGPIGIPYKVVGARAEARAGDASSTPTSPTRARTRSRATRRSRAAANADGDRHVLVVDRDRCRLYELFDAHPLDGGARWRAGSGAIFDLRSNRLRPAGWTSADAAGLPILPGLARYGEVAKGSIDHALRFTARRTRRAYVYPARHFASERQRPRAAADGPARAPEARRRASTASARRRGSSPARCSATARCSPTTARRGSSPARPTAAGTTTTCRRCAACSGSDFEVVDTRRCRAA